MSDGGGFDQVVLVISEQLKRQADSYIAHRPVEFGLEDRLRENLDMRYLQISLRHREEDLASVRKVEMDSSLSYYELLDHALTALTHMSLEMGLIETTDPNSTHQIIISGSSWDKAEVQLDGHTLRGVYRVSYELEAGTTPKIGLEFSRSAVYLDQKVLPEDLTLKIKGMEDVMGALQAVVDLRNKRFQDLEYAQKHSDEEESALFKEVTGLLRKYEVINEVPVGEQVH